MIAWLLNLLRRMTYREQVTYHDPLRLAQGERVLLNRTEPIV